MKEEHTVTADLRIQEFETLAPPQELIDANPATEEQLRAVVNGREAIRKCLTGKDDRLLVVVGPCSIHDPKAALEYAEKLAALSAELSQQLLIVMRVYFEKPRTTIGWKGLINDPNLDGSCDVNKGLRTARQVLLDINALGLSCGTEFLDPIVPQYISDLVTWAAIGARTTESQTHREMASGVSMPVGFKNATDGSLDIALAGMLSSKSPHAFLGIKPDGAPCVVRTRGNPDVHLVLRGGKDNKNYTKPHLAFARTALEEFDLARAIMVDCSHGNSDKDYTKQPNVFRYVVETYAAGERAILGAMLESNLVAGRQSVSDSMVYGQSVTDACIDWNETETLLQWAAEQLGK